MMHEDAHAATHDEINSQMSEPNNYAHEIAAHHLQYPGGRSQDDKAISDLLRPALNPIRNDRKPPRGVIR